MNLLGKKTKKQKTDLILALMCFLFFQGNFILVPFPAYRKQVLPTLPTLNELNFVSQHRNHTLWKTIKVFEKITQNFFFFCTPPPSPCPYSPRPPFPAHPPNTVVPQPHAEWNLPWGPFYIKCRYKCCDIAGEVTLIKLLRFLNKPS